MVKNHALVDGIDSMAQHRRLLDLNRFGLKLKEKDAFQLFGIKPAQQKKTFPQLQIGFIFGAHHQFRRSED